MNEQQNIEWKQSWRDEYLKWICGFANAQGGKIFIGKDDDGNVVHLEDYRKLLEDIPSKVRNHLGIICDVNLHDENGSKFIEIVVHPYTVPVSLRGRYYYRSGSSKVELTGIELNEFLLKKAGGTWDEVIENRATLDDIDETALETFIKDGQKIGRMPDVEGLSTIEILEKLHLSKDGMLKRAALVMFGKDPIGFYPTFEVKIGRFVLDSTDLRFQEVVRGNVVGMLKEVLSQLDHKFLVRNVSFEGMYRVEKEEFPNIALRETLLNALVHRTYMGAHVQMRVYDDRLTLWNEGMLPLGVTIDNLKKTHNSRPRNPLIASACFMAGYIDSWGRGIKKIVDSCLEAGLPEPEIIEMDGGIQVTLYKEKVVSEKSEKKEVSNQENYFPQMRKQKAERMTALMIAINNNPSFSRIQLAEFIKVPEDSVTKYLSELENKLGYIESKGTTTDRTYSWTSKAITEFS